MVAQSVGGLSLRTKLIVGALAGAASTMLYLYLRLKLASKRAATAEAKAEKLEQARALEKRIAQARAKR